MKQQNINIIFLGHEIYKNTLFILRFIIDDANYRRVCMLKRINNFEKGQLLWWKKNDDEYLDEEETIEFENIAETFFKTINLNSERKAIGSA